MVSRRKILSRSKDDLNFETFHQDEEDVDIWYQKEKLFREHIQEVLDKWSQIDDEIWAKIIVFEKNRRVAKAYARTPVLTINGSDDGFDGMRIGLCGFDNPMRDQKTEEVKHHIGQGIKLKMDECGNILVRRYSKSGIFVKGTGNSGEETAIGNEILKSPNLNLELEKIMKVFDMKKFESNLNRELSRAYPDRRRLETQCLSVLAFVKSEVDILDCPIWVLIVNVVAIDMLKSKLPPVRRALDIKNRPRIPIPDEKIDPYASATSSSYGTGIYGQSKSSMLIPSHFHRQDKPPKLPPRDNMYTHRDLLTVPLKTDYDEIQGENRVKLMFKGRSDKNKYPKSYDDPYYSGLRARVPNFSKEKARRESQTNEEIYVSRREPRVSRRSIANMDRHQPTFSSLYQLNQVNDPRTSLYQRLHHHGQSSPSKPFLWHARSYESGIDSEIVESPYQPIYGRVQNRTHVGAYKNIRRPSNFIGDWE